MWEHYWTYHNSQLLTVGLIINEQQLIEQNIIRNSVFQKRVLENIAFLIQDHLGLTKIIIPYKKSRLFTYRIIGYPVQFFDQVDNRISLGKIIYQLLFSRKSFKGAYQFCINKEHTGSRSDYWPKLNKNHPTLQKAWKPVVHTFLHKKEWYTDDTSIKKEVLFTLPVAKRMDLSLKIISSTYQTKVLNFLQSSIYKKAKDL
ncbi:DUF2515 family protein [Bacillus carboniphilus]|uniref:DUF2515 family protein n=1 Tax=Bacillus carboniphilus TaxID=86663 RepID=A0ABY9K2W6_9BACI|nr:DUF2515 family protein [Bacillus carboniphilus]WLR44251.1 DUF2515 family protein [Bacillus carboniphilus]